MDELSIAEHDHWLASLDALDAYDRIGKPDPIVNLTDEITAIIDVIDNYHDTIRRMVKEISDKIDLIVEARKGQQAGEK